MLLGYIAYEPPAALKHCMQQKVNAEQQCESKVALGALQRGLCYNALFNAADMLQVTGDLHATLGV